MTTHRMRVLVAGVWIASCGGGGGGDGTTMPPSTGIGSLDTGVDTSGATTAGETASDKLDLGVQPDLPPDTDSECASQMVDAELSLRPVDVLMVVDTSSSMGDAIAAMEASINDNFAAILEQSGLDYRVIVVSEYPAVCIVMPLSGTDCNPAPAMPAVNDHYTHYNGATGSGNFLDLIVERATTPDPFGLMPGGYVDALRPDSVKTIVGMTDGESASNDTAQADAFDAAMLGLANAPFGTVGDRQYTFHLFTSMPVNNPPATPWGPADPLQGEGHSIQQVSILTGGLRFPFTQTADFATVFNTIATGVVEATPVACEFTIPVPDDGGMIDPDTIEVDYTPGGVGAPQTFHQVVGLGDCAADAFYISGDTVFLCPTACGVVQADATAQIDVRYGCDVGFDPAG